MVSYLSGALPVRGRAFSLRTQFNRSLCDSLKYLLGACSEVIPSALFSKAMAKLNLLQVDSKLSGLLGAIHFDLLRAIEKNDIQRLDAIINRLIEDDFEIKEIKFINISEFSEYYLPIVKEIFSQELDRPVTYYTLSPEDFKRIKQSVNQTFEVIKHTAPDFYEEVQDLISEIVLVNADGLNEGSSSDLFGMFYYSYVFKWEKTTDVIAVIIHELSHLYIHLLANDDEMILNPLERYESPLRADKRPLIGIYHATFVLARVVYVLNKALSLGQISENEKVYCQELMDYYQKRHEVGFKILNEHAQMTPLGKELILSANKLLQNSSSLGKVA